MDNQDPNDRPAHHREPLGRRAARLEADEGAEGNDAAAMGQEFPPASDREPKITGFDAETSDAEAGDAGNGASPNGADLSGLAYDVDNQDHLTSLEADSGQAPDILPDHVEPEEEDEEFRPIPPSMWP